MMSTAILMAMGAEQSTKQPVAQDAGKLEGPTFAQTLDARVGISPVISPRESKVATPLEAPIEKTELATKNPMEVPDVATGAKAKVLVGQTTQVRVRTKILTAERLSPCRPQLKRGHSFRRSERIRRRRLSSCP